VPSQKSAQLPQDTLAWIGPRVITSHDLLERMELMPFPESQKGVDPESLKAMTLRAMIAEKVLADERRRLELPDDRGSVLMQRELENALVRDELYRRQVLDHATAGKEEIAVGLKRLGTDVRVISFLVPSASEGNRLAGMLKSGKPGNLLRNIPPSLYTQQDTITIKFGAADTAFEHAAYSIGPSRVSGPFHSPAFGWAVLYLLDRTANLVAAKMDLADRHRRVEKMLRARHESDRYEEYYREILGPRTALADTVIFNLLADSIAALWGEDTAHFMSRGSYILTGDLVELIASRLYSHRDSLFVNIDTGNLTLGEVLEMLRYADFRSKEREGLQFRKNLNGELRDLVGQALLSREGRKQALQYAPSVKKDLELWSDYWRAREMYYRVRDSVTVSDGDILRHLEKYKDIFGRYYEVNLREVLCDSLPLAGAVLDEIGRGESFSRVASKYSRRAAWARNGGASGWFRVDGNPAIGFEAMNADTGKIIGPVRLAEGWSLFQVLGKRPTGKSVPFDVLKNNVRARLLDEKRTLAVDRCVADLVRSRHVTIDAGKLKRITVTHVPMFTRRLIGFGGRMAAFPMLMKAWDWVSQPAPPETVIP
jgi:peptidyl-prolyl cis-trans isomerase C